LRTSANTPQVVSADSSSAGSVSHRTTGPMALWVLEATELTALPVAITPNRLS
jgi:hypothetical protein